MYQGTFKESFPTKYGHGVKLTVPGGNEWTVFGKGPKPEFAPGTALEFEATSNGKTWSYSMLRLAASVAPVQPPAAPAAPYQPPGPLAPQPTPAGAAVAPNLDKERDMFVTGVVGRAMGSGQFGFAEIKMLALAADDAWLELAAKRQGRALPPPPAQAAADGPPPGDPRFQAPF